LIPPAWETTTMSAKTTKNDTQPKKPGAKGETQTEKQASEATSKTGDSTGKATAARISPYRLRMVELATQLVSAQISASASYQIALDLAREQCELIKDLSKLFLSGEEPKEEEFFGRMTRYSGISLRRPRELKPLSFGEFDELFESAMYRAQWMLKSPKRDNRVVYAEQLFEEDEVLTENQIYDRFHAYGWPALKSRKMVTALMADVDSLYSSHFEYLNTQHASAEFSQRNEKWTRQYEEDLKILLPAQELCRKVSRNRFDSHGRRFRAAASAIDYLIDLRTEGGYENILLPIDSDRDKKLIIHMFNDSEPRPREQIDAEKSSSGKKKSPTRYYRPWGIFRFLRLHGETYPSFDGHALNLKLKTERRKLNSDMVPKIRRVNSEEYRFGPLSDFVDRSYPPEPVDDSIQYEMQQDAGAWVPSPVVQSKVE